MQPNERIIKRIKELHPAGCRVRALTKPTNAEIVLTQ